MVSKVAVIALVAIVACPILLGYAMNLSEVSETDYRVSGESVNVTPLLYTGSEYTAANADINKLNTDFTWISSEKPIYPLYNKLGLTKTSLPIYTGSNSNWSGETQNLTNVVEYFALLEYNYSANSYFTANFYVGGSMVDYVNRIIYIHYDSSNSSIEFTAQTSSTGTRSGVIYGSFTSIQYVPTGGQTATRYNAALYDGSNSIYYADISAGYYFNKMYSYESIKIMMPERTQSVLFSVNLDSITDANYTLKINDALFLRKITQDGNITWSAYKTDINGDPIWWQDLYYNPGISNNTYQIKINSPDERMDSTDPNRPSPTWYQYHRYVEFRYVGSWPTLIGEANYYQKYDYDYWMYWQPDDSYFSGLWLDPGTDHRTPTIRVDVAQFQAFQYQVIENNTYQPSSFKQNPSTTVSNVQRTGSQLIFGGNTYTVTKGKITIGSHSIPVEGLVFSSVPNGSGTYDNKIGNTLVSTTADPSTIEFIGKWSVSVSTASMESYTYTKTEWTPGQFGWDGIDHNFLIVGLLTSLGVFIALGIYIRRSKANLWPLLLVCGGAAMLFFCML